MIDDLPWILYLLAGTLTSLWARRYGRPSLICDILIAIVWWYFLLCLAVVGFYRWQRRRV